MPDPVRVTLYNDAGCPWGYSANPAFRVLEWRYGAQLEWRLVLIGLTNVAQEYVDRGYTPLRSAEGYARRFRRFGMPMGPLRLLDEVGLDVALKAGKVLAAAFGSRAQPSGVLEPLVGGAQLFIGRFQLLDGRLQRFTRVLQVPFEFGDPCLDPRA